MLKTNRKAEGGRDGRVPFDYPPINSPSVTYDRDQDKVSIVGQAVHPESNRASGVSVRLSMSSEDAMRLMRLLQRLQRDEGFEVPNSRLHVVESAQPGASGKWSGSRSWLGSITAMLPKRRGG